MFEWSFGAMGIYVCVRKIQWMVGVRLQIRKKGRNTLSTRTVDATNATL